MSLRKKLVVLAHSNPGPLREAILGILAEETPKTAARKRAPKKTYPRATKRPPAKKFREGISEWATRDIQETLEAAGVPQERINSAVAAIAGYQYGVIHNTTFSGGYTAQNYKHFATQQEVVDWLAGKSEVDATATWGEKRYPAILQAFIDRYGAGNNAARDKVQGEWNKLKKHQKAIAVAFLGFRGTTMRYADSSIQEMEESLPTMSGENAQQLLKVVRWAAKIPMWPKV